MNMVVTILTGLMPVVCLAESLQIRTSDPISGAETWETHAHGVTFSLTQILPDHVRAFYVNRGSTIDQIEPYAKSCVFMTVLRNDDAPGRIHYVRDNWSILSDGNSRPPENTSDWLQRLKNNNVKKSALIAFRWAQFPTEQEYEPGGDWNQGMLSAGLPPGSRFDVIARWDIKGKPYEARLKEVLCAE